MTRKSKQPQGQRIAPPPQPARSHRGDPPADPTDDADDGPLFFYLPNAVHGEFCQWYPSVFTVSESEISSLIGDSPEDAPETSGTHEMMTFNCAEQFMMYCKAGRFHDKSTQRRVMATDSPKEQKRLGKSTSGFWDARWDEVKSEVVVAGNMAKFGQDPKLERKLLATGDRLLVEASSRDRVWGIGYTAKHAMQYQKHWGENRLGKALMETRRRLRREKEKGGEAYEDEDEDEQ